MSELPKSLHPEHRADLYKSGISDDTIKEAGIYLVNPNSINKIMGWNAPVKSLLALPYPGRDFIRYKLFPALVNKEGHSQKYFQAKGSSLQIYLPPKFNPDAGTLRITEGKKNV
jgi:hypothetical protein